MWSAPRTPAAGSQGTPGSRQLIGRVCVVAAASAVPLCSASVRFLLFNFSAFQTIRCRCFFFLLATGFTRFRSSSQPRSNNRNPLSRDGTNRRQNRNILRSSRVVVWLEGCGGVLQCLGLLTAGRKTIFAPSAIPPSLFVVVVFVMAFHLNVCVCCSCECVTPNGTLATDVPVRT